MTFIFSVLVIFFVGGAAYLISTPPASKYEREYNERKKYKYYD